ncbi:MAG TPA: replicative DNA helicase [Candidatus Avilachnospira avistercoris]|nr:replicative DNA helicase [Candidatus Avilachnospira avistercoris]
MEDNILKRTAPSSIEAEMSVVGSMLMDKDAITEAIEILSKEDFYHRQYGIMFEAIRELYNEDKPVDLVTVRDRLQRDGAPPEMQASDFLRDLLAAVPTSVNIRTYAEMVHEKAILRRLIKSSESIIEECYDGGKDTEEILNDTERALFELIKSKGAREYVPIDDVVLEVMQRIQEASQLKDHITGVPSGFSDLDFMTTGFQPSDFILVAARPSMGKTAFVLNILEFVAIKKNRPCMIFSLEMSSNQLVNRLLSMDSGVDAQLIRSGRLTDSDWPRLIDSADRVGASNIIIDDTPGISVPELRSKCRKVKLERGLDLIIIDYLQLMSGSSKKSDNRQQEVSDISRSLKALAREMECPVIALSQLSRACELRADKRPMLSDLRESGAIEQDADVVMFLYRDEYYEPDSEHKGEAEVIIAKQRNGPIGTVTLYWQASTTRFVSKERVYN